MAACCAWKLSRCFANSLWIWSGRTPTEENKDLNTDSSSWRSSTFFCSRSFSLARILTLSSVSLVLILAFSRDFLTATLFLSRRLRYSSEPFSLGFLFFLLDPRAYFGCCANDLRQGRGPPRLKGSTGDIWSDVWWPVELETAQLLL